MKEKRKFKALRKEARKKKGNQKLRQAWAELIIPDYKDWTIFSMTQFFTTSVDEDEFWDHKDPVEILNHPIEVFEAIIESL